MGLRFLRHIERNAILLFLVPADANDIHAEYKILLSELEQHNPELLDKQRILAISKSDMLDDELTEALKQDLPNIPYVFISSVTGLGISELKDLLWAEINKDSNRIISHKPLDVKNNFEEDKFNEEDFYEEDFEEELDDEELFDDFDSNEI